MPVLSIHLHPLELLCLSFEPGPGLGLAQSQDSAKLLDGDVIVKELADLRQRDPQVAQDQDAVQPRHLTGRIVPVASDRIDVSRLEQAEVVVVPQGAHRHLSQPRQRAYPVHGTQPTS